MSRIFKALVALGFMATISACTAPTEEVIVVDPGDVMVAPEPVYDGKL